MRTPITLAFALISSSALAAVPPDVASAPGAATLPTADGVWVRRHLSVVLDAQGRVAREVEQAIKPFTDNPMRNGLLDPHITWDDGRASLEVLQAVTWMADGTEVPALANSLVPNTQPALEWAVPYAHMRDLVVSHVGVEHGSTSLLHYRVADRGATGAPLWGVEPLADGLPIQDLLVRIEVPAGTALQVGLVGGAAVQPQVSDDGVRHLVQVHATGIYGLNTRENDGALGVPKLAWSTARDWKHLRSYLEAQVAPSIVADSYVQAKLQQVLDGSLEPEERLARIHDFIVKGVRSIDWPAAEFGYATRAAPQVLDSSVGHALDKAVLEAAMLRAAGFTAHVALVRASPEALPDVPAPVLFDQIWVRVARPGGDVWLEPTAGLDGANRCTIDGRPALVLDGKAEAPAAVTGCGEQRAAVRLHLELAPEGEKIAASGYADLDLHGRYNPVVAYDRAKDRMKGLGGGYAGLFGDGERAVVPALHSLDGTSARASFTGGHLEIPASGLVRIDLPRVPGAVTAGDSQAWRGERTLPVAVPAPGREEVALEITLPKGWEPAHLPEAVELKNDVGAFTRVVTRDGDKLTVLGTLVLAREVVAAADWPQLRALLLAADAPSAGALLLKKMEE
ncbi:MAG: DUF3857 domain-containing protein [Pseudomonadota bacterium]